MHTSCASSPGSSPEGLPGAKVTVLLGEGEEERPILPTSLSPSKPVPRVSRRQQAPLACSAEVIMVHCSLDTAAPREPLGTGMETQKERGPEFQRPRQKKGKQKKAVEGKELTLDCSRVCVCVCVRARVRARACVCVLVFVIP